MEDSSNSDDEQPMQVKKGVKKGTKRGKYHRNGDAKNRVLAAAINGNWKTVATANGIPIHTAYGWIRKGDEPTKPRGGRRFIKVQERHVDKLLDWLSENPLLTLTQMKDKLMYEEHLNVSTNTIHDHLDGKSYTLKKVVVEPVTMNSDINKNKRADYVRSLMAASGLGKRLIYIDESNSNLFLRRLQGRSKKGMRCSVKAACARGPNVHIIGGISQLGLVYWERRRGSYKNYDCCEWLRTLLRSVHDNMERIVIVCDNAPVHVRIEAVAEEPEFAGVTIIRSAPYSAPLNPIEECWSVMKADMKRNMAATFNQMMAPPIQGMTQTEHRLRYLEAAIDESMLTITPLLCMRTCNHVQRHFANCLALQDLQMGDNLNI